MWWIFLIPLGLFLYLLFAIIVGHYLRGMSNSYPPVESYRNIGKFHESTKQ